MDIFICASGYDGLDRVLNVKNIEFIRELPNDYCSIRYIEDRECQMFHAKGYAKLKEALVCKAYDMSESVNVE